MVNSVSWLLPSPVVFSDGSFVYLSRLSVLRGCFFPQISEFRLFVCLFFNRKIAGWNLMHVIFQRYRQWEVEMQKGGSVCRLVHPCKSMQGSTWTLDCPIHPSVHPSLPPSILHLHPSSRSLIKPSAMPAPGSASVQAGV